MKTVEIIWLMLIMVLCAITDSSSTKLNIVLSCVAIPFVLYMINKEAKEYAKREADKLREEVKRAVKE